MYAEHELMADSFYVGTVGDIISPWQKFAILSPVSEYLSEIRPMLFHYILCIFKPLYSYK